MIIRTTHNYYYYTHQVANRESYYMLYYCVSIGKWYYFFPPRTNTFLITHSCEYFCLFGNSLVSSLAAGHQSQTAQLQLIETTIHLTSSLSAQAKQHTHIDKKQVRLGLGILIFYSVFNPIVFLSALTYQTLLIVHHILLSRPKHTPSVGTQ